MQPIQLITFDVFGTLLDWQAYVDQAYPGTYDLFLSASSRRQIPGQAVLPYTKLLAEVGLELSPRSAHASGAAGEMTNFFAEGMGFAEPFADSRAIQFLSHMAMIGALSNCDYRHLLDVQKTLGTVFDVALCAEEVGAYKPHAEAWDAFYDHVTQKLGFDRRGWMHVTAYADFDLAPAKERGITTCFIQRPGGSDEAAARAAMPDVVVSDLWELTDVIAKRNGIPVRYVVKASARTPEISRDFADWVRRHHGPDLLQVLACQEFQIVRLSDTVVCCEYIFSNKSALNDYLAGPATELRKKGRARYSEEDLGFERSDVELSAGYRHRSRHDFVPRPLT